MGPKVQFTSKSKVNKLSEDHVRQIEAKTSNYCKEINARISANKTNHS